MLWLSLWVVLSIFILCVFVWSLQITLQQKKTWRAFAEKAGLVYDNGPRLMMPPSVRGKIRGVNVHLFTAVQQSPDIRGERYNTVIEISSGTGMPAGGYIATENMAHTLPGLQFFDVFTPHDADWNSDWIVRTGSPAMMEAYLTQKRAEILKRILRMKIILAFLHFDTQNMILYIETSDAMSDPVKLEKIITSLVQQFETLMTDRAEYDRLKDLADSSRAPKAVVENAHAEAPEV